MSGRLARLDQMFPDLFMLCLSRTGGYGYFFNSQNNVFWIHPIYSVNWDMLVADLYNFVAYRYPPQHISAYAPLITQDKSPFIFVSKEKKELLKQLATMSLL